MSGQGFHPRNPQKWAWFKRTLFGYTLVFMNVDYEYVVIHRPFRQPIMKSTRITKAPLRGMKIDQIIYDELTEHPFIKPWLKRGSGAASPTHPKVESDTGDK